MRLIELGNLFYLQGNLEAFKQNAREGLSLKNSLLETHKVFILETILSSLYLEQPASSTRLLGIIDYSEREYDLLQGPIVKRYCGRAEAHSREMLGDAAFAAAFAEGQEMSLDEALDLVLKVVEEM